MKLLKFLVLFVFCISVQAQRRPARIQTTTENESPKPISRGRARFSSNPENVQTTAERRSETDNRRTSTRRKVNAIPETISASPVREYSNTRPQTNSYKPAKEYEVREIVDDIPFPKRTGRTRTITETSFEAANAPQSSPLYEPYPVTEETAAELYKSFGSTLSNNLSTKLPETRDESSQSSSTTSAFSASLEEDVHTKDTSKESSREDSGELHMSSEEPIAKPSTDISSVYDNFKREPPKTSQEATTKSIDARREPARRRTVKTRVHHKPEENQPDSSRHTNIRNRGSRIRDEHTTVTPNVTPRSRSSRRKPDSASSASSETPATRTRTPSVLSAEDTHHFVSRSRTGRKIDTSATKKHENNQQTYSGRKAENSPQKLNLDLSESRTTESRTSTTTKIRPTTAKPTIKSSVLTTRRSSSRLNSRTPKEIAREPKVKSRGRTKSRDTGRDFLLDIDETKLEVLPLFESEDKIVRPNKYSRGRNYNSNEESVQISATNSEPKLVPKPEKNEITTSTEKSVRITQKRTFAVESSTQPSFKPRKDFKRPPKTQIKESVVSQVSEVTSKRIVGRRRNPSNNKIKNKVAASEKGANVKTEEPKISTSQVVTSSRLPKSRGRATYTAKAKHGDGNHLTNSQEEIDETDNYPEEFKALIQAKKNNKVSRPGSPSAEVTTQRSTIVTPLPQSNVVTLVSVITADGNKEINDVDNELDPKSSTPLPSNRPTRRLFTTTKKPLTEKPKRTTYPSRKSIRSTLAPSELLTKKGYKSSTAKTTTPETAAATKSENIAKKDHRFHARFTASTRNLHEVTSPASVSKGRSYTGKPRGLYSSSNRKYKDGEKPSVSRNYKHSENAPNKVSLAPSGIKKPLSRFSSRYRGDISGRGGVSIRSSSSTPIYKPTVPTVTPHTSEKPGVTIEDKELGLEIIMFDDPVNTISSADLVNGEYLSSTAKNHFFLTATSPSVSTSTTEKTVSIIERIINSITSINTTTEESATKSITHGTESTDGSAILKLASKKPDKLTFDKLDKTTQHPNSLSASTSEKPTTIIQKILTSLSAIQADDSDGRIGHKQVGTTNFNTVSLDLTSPMPRVTKAIGSSSLLAHKSTTVNPLSVFDEIGEEQVLEKRTIGKLLALLNSLTTHSPLVVVTPKVPTTFGGFVNSVDVSKSVVNTPSISTTVDNATPFVQTIPSTTQSTSSTSTTTSSPPLFTSSNEDDTNVILSGSPKATTTTEAEAATTTAIPTQNRGNTPSETTTVPPTATTTDNGPRLVITPDIRETISTIFSTTTTPEVSSTEKDIGLRAGFTEIITTTAQTPTKVAAQTKAPVSSNSTTLDITNGVEVLSLFVNKNTTSSLIASTQATPLMSSSVSSSTDSVLTTVSAPSTSTSDMSSNTIIVQSPVVSNATSTASVTTTTITAPFTNKDISSNTISQSPVALIESRSGTTTEALPNTNELRTSAPITTTSTEATTLTPTIATVNGTTMLPLTTNVKNNEVGTTTQPSIMPRILEIIPIPPSNQIQQESTTSPSVVGSTSQGVLFETITTPTPTITTPQTATAIPPESTTYELQEFFQPMNINDFINSLKNLVSSSESRTSTQPAFVTTTQTATAEPTESTETIFTYPSTIPALINFEVSPGSVSIFSANDLSNQVTLDDNISTVTIAGRTNILTDFSTTTQGTTTANVNTGSTTGVSTTTVQKTTDSNTTQMPEISGRININSTNAPATTTTESQNTTTTLASTTQGSTSAATKQADSSAAITQAGPNAETTQASISAGTTQADTSALTTQADPGVATTQAIANIITTQATENRITQVSNREELTTSSPTTNAPQTTTALSGTNVTTTAEADKSNSSQSTAVPNDLLLSTSNPPTNSTGSSVTFTSPPVVSNSTVVQNNTSVSVTNTTTTSNDTQSSFANRSGRLLGIDPNPVQNSIESSSAAPERDYFIFAVLNNNTILRKRPSPVPNKDTPFVIVGVYPNNTVVRKYPNGTEIPMEPVIRVRGFDTRNNPPPLEDITSNQVTPDRGNSGDTDVRTVFVVNNFPRWLTKVSDTRNSVEANPLSISSTSPSSSVSSSTTSTSAQSTPESSSTTTPNPVDNTIEGSSGNTTPRVPSPTTTVGTTTTGGGSTVESSTSTVELSDRLLSSTTVSSTSAASTASSTTTTQMPTATLPSLNEILNGKTVQAFNNLVNRTEQIKTIDVDPKTNQVLNFDKPKYDDNIVYRWKPVTGLNFIDVVNINDLKTTTITDTKASLENRIGPLASPTTSTAAAPSTLQATTTTTLPPTTTTQIPTTTTVPTTTTQRTTTAPPTLARIVTTTTAPTTTTTTTRPPTTTTTQPTTTSRQPTTQAQNTVQVTGRITKTPTSTLPSNGPTQPTLRPMFQSTTFFPFFSTILSTLQPILSTPPTPLRSATRSGRITTPRVPTTTTSAPTTTTLPTTANVRTTTRARALPQENNILDILTRGTTGLIDFNAVATSPIPVTTTLDGRNIDANIIERRRSTTSATATQGRGVSTTTKRSTGKKELTEEQKKNIQILAELEKEQQTILKQLAFLTNLQQNLGGQKTATADKNNLANRIIAVAMERDKEKTTTTASLSKKASPSLEEILKQYNLQGLETVTPSSLPTTYGTSGDAILAALLKQHGIEPTTPRSLGDQLKESGAFQDTKPAKPRTTKRPRTTTTTQAPGRLRQGLSWLLNAFAPPITTTTKRPKAKKSKKKTSTTSTTPSSQEVETLSNQPTHITPIVQAAPIGSQNQQLLNSLSQNDVKKLIKQLEEVQRNPKAANQVDVNSLKSLQSLITGIQAAQAVTPTPRLSTKLPAISKVTIPNSVEILPEFSTTTTTTVRPIPPSTTSTSKSVSGIDITSVGRAFNFSILTSSLSAIGNRGVQVVTPTPTRLSTKSPVVSKVSSPSPNSLEFLTNSLTTTTAKPKLSLPPVSLKPIAGIDTGDSEPLVRGQLITAAVNVTRAISQFLGSALQGAAHSFQSIIGSGSRMVGQVAQGSSSVSSRPG